MSSEHPHGRTAKGFALILGAARAAGLTPRRSACALVRKAERDELVVLAMNDPLMAAAVRRTRKTLPKFLALAKRPGPTMEGFAVKIAIGVLIATQLMNCFFVPWMAHAGLALSIGLGACLNAALLFRGLRHRHLYTPQPGWRLFLIKLTGALFLLGGVALTVARHFDWIAMRAHPAERIGALLLVLVACGVTYFGALMAMGFRYDDFKRIRL